MGVATAIGIGGAVAGGVLGSRSQKKAAERGAEATTEAAQLAAGVQRQNFLDTTALNVPRAQAGDAATARMLQLLGMPVPDSLTSGAAYEQILSGGGNALAGVGSSLDDRTNLRWGGFDPKAYLAANPDVLDHYNRNTRRAHGEAFYVDGKRKDVRSPEDFAAYHWSNYGRADNRSLGLDEAAGEAGPVNQLTGEYAIDVPELGAGGVNELIKSTPGYQFRFDEGIRAADSSAASRGMLMSGAQLRRLQEFGDDYAAQEFGNYWNRLASVAGAGQVATQGIAGAGTNAANNLANIYQQQGQNLATSYGQQGAANANMWNTIGQGVGMAGGYAAQRWF